MIPAKTVDETKVALERYRNVLGYLQYENTIYWTRSGFMLVANSALLGFVARAIFEPAQITSWGHTLAWLAVGIFGLILSHLWGQALRNTLWWIDRWHSVLLRLEPAAYGEIKVFREAVSEGDHKASRHRARRTAGDVALLFSFAWILVIAYGLAIASRSLCAS